MPKVCDEEDSCDDEASAPTSASSVPLKSKLLASKKPPKSPPGASHINYHYARERRVGANGERSKKLQTASEFHVVFSPMQLTHDGQRYPGFIALYFYILVTLASSQVPAVNT